MGAVRKPFICGNWKMHMLPDPAAAFVRALAAKIGRHEGVDVAVAPAFVALPAVHEALEGSSIGLFAQNCHWAEQGAFTGEVSAPMLKAVGCAGAIVGHSERRQHFGETDATVHARAKAVLAAGLQPIVCVGETLAEREQGQTLEVVGRQIRAVFGSFTSPQVARCVVAYEPVWAIGTGKVATAAQAQEVHAAIRGWLAEIAGAETAGTIRIQYGGSARPENAAEILRQPDVDGALVGGASLKVDEFAAIVALAGAAKG
jgi:triosephosphate isomerase